MTTNTYKIDFTTNTMTITRSFELAANCPGSREYELLKKIMADFPSMTIVRKTCIGRPSRYRGLTYDAMERYILISGNDTLLDEFHQVRQFAAMSGNAYCYVRSWFLTRFADYQERMEYAA